MLFLGEKIIVLFLKSFVKFYSLCLGFESFICVGRDIKLVRNFFF